MVKGIRIFGDMSTFEDERIKDVDFYKDDIFELIEANGMTVTGHCSKTFGPGAFTLNIMLSESHVCIHTWPEKCFYSLDVHTCNFSKDNDEGAKKMFKEITELFPTDSLASKVTTV